MQPPIVLGVVASAQAGILAWRGGATMLQLRSPRAAAAELEAEAEQLMDLCPLPLVVNGRPDVARAVAAAGVHLPEQGMPIAAARKVLGGRGRVGRSVHSPDGARLAGDEGADYVVLGPIFSTASHPDQPGLGLEVLAMVAREMAFPVLAIGGITRSQIPACLEAGARGVAGIGMFVVCGR